MTEARYTDTAGPKHLRTDNRHPSTVILVVALVLREAVLVPGQLIQYRRRGSLVHADKVAGRADVDPMWVSLGASDANHRISFNSE